MKKKLVRLDKLLAEKQALTSRTAAQSYIEEGRVRVDGITVTKSASMVPVDSVILLDAPE